MFCCLATNKCIKYNNQMTFIIIMIKTATFFRFKKIYNSCFYENSTTKSINSLIGRDLFWSKIVFK